MKIIKPSFEVWERDGLRGNIATIERAGRLCYKSEGKPGTTDKFVRNLILSKHNSVLEHGDMVFEVSAGVYVILSNVLNNFRDAGELAPMLAMTHIGGRYIVSGNIRAWRELFASGESIGAAFISQFDPVFVQGYGFIWEDSQDFGEVRRIQYSDMKERNEQRVHIRQTVHFICDRAVQNEFVRHRLMSFSVESSRYCDYNSGKFGGELTVIEPPFFPKNTIIYDTWKHACEWSETAYQKLRMFQRPAQEARSVLPLSVKTEMAVTGDLRSWDHFFDLRARQVTGAAHPQAVELAAPLMGELTMRFPDAIGGD